MTLLDMIARWVQRVLAVLDPETARFLFIPAFVFVVVLGAVLFVRKLLPPACALAAILTRWAITLLGAFVLLAEMAVAAGFRQTTGKPPALLYNFGDAVASWVTSLSAGAQVVAGQLARVARMNLVLLLLLAGGWIWLWNYDHCPDGAKSCARPVSVWYAQVSSD